MKKSETRKRTETINVRVTPEERARIKKTADECVSSLGILLRSLGVGYRPKSKLDQRAVMEIAEGISTLGRLGGLLKLWISQVRLGAPTQISPEEIDQLYRDMQASQALLKARIQEL